MSKVVKISLNHYKNCYNLLCNDNGDLHYFKKLGWSLNQFKVQISKYNNYGLGIFNDNLLEGFLLGNVLTIEKKIEYEILLLYVTTNKRRLGHATKLLDCIFRISNINILKKIYLEVASNNLHAIKLYKKNKFIQIGIRKNYYFFENKKIDAYCFEKIIND